jgi:hypothetical protein
VRARVDRWQTLGVVLVGLAVLAFLVRRPGEPERPRFFAETERVTLVGLEDEETVRATSRVTGKVLWETNVTTAVLAARRWPESRRSDDIVGHRGIRDLSVRDGKAWVTVARANRGTLDLETGAFFLWGSD